MHTVWNPACKFWCRPEPGVVRDLDYGYPGGGLRVGVKLFQDPGIRLLFALGADNTCI